MPIPSFDEIRSSSTRSMEKLSGAATGAMEKAKFKLMKRTGEEDEDNSEQSIEEESQASSYMEEFTDTYCPTLTFQQVRAST